MRGYIDYLGTFIAKSGNDIVERLKKYYPDAEDSQINSWIELISVLKHSKLLSSLSGDLLIGVEYSLPVDSMAVDLFIYGSNKFGRQVLYILESKQWGDEYIFGLRFGNYRQDDVELYPQTQINKHKIAINGYLDMGDELDVVKPWVYIENASQNGLKKAKNHRDPVIGSIPMTNDIDTFLANIIKDGLTKGKLTITDFYNAKYCPTKSIIDAMESIVTKEEPFVLTPSQEEALRAIAVHIQQGKKVIHVDGSAGSGKTAILLNMFVRLLKRRGVTGLEPYFSSGGQNTALYRSLYGEVRDLFSYTYPLERYAGPGTILLIDEAQTNKNGLIMKLVESGATVVFCYDPWQVVNLDHSVTELDLLKKRPDYVHVTLTESVRFNGSQRFDIDIKNYLSNGVLPEKDDKYLFKSVNSMQELRNVVSELTKDKDATIALSGLLCENAETVVKRSRGLFFTKWGDRQETEWIPYVLRKKYATEYNGSFWLGTWWLPGLDVDYSVVVVGSDAIMTPQGLIGDAFESKLHDGVNSVLNNISVPQSDRNRGACKGLPAFDTYCHEPGKEHYKQEFESTFDELIRHYYYIMLTRGRKGCVVYFTEKTLL